jgi:hypothetical protein
MPAPGACPCEETLHAMQQPVTRSEIMDIAQYETMRPTFRQQAIAEKEHRRVRVGEHFTLLFENHLTVLYQVQEMLRIERIVDDAAIQHEIDTYNELIPPEGGLSVSLLIEYDDPRERAIHLPRLLGIEKHVWLKVGRLTPVPAQFDTRQIGEDRVSSVQYFTFSLPAEHRRQWMELGQAGLIQVAIDHPHYSHETALIPAQAAALAEDLD